MRSTGERLSELAHNLRRMTGWAPRPEVPNAQESVGQPSTEPLPDNAAREAHIGAAGSGPDRNAPHPDPRVETAPKSPAARAAAHLGDIPRRSIGSSGISVPPVALGTSVFGWTMDRHTSVTVLDRYVGLGGEFIDTADNYAAGVSEMVIGNWMRSRRNRDRVTIATKVGRGSEFPGLGRASMHEAVHASLHRLGTEYIDVLYFHIEDRAVHLEDSLAAAHELMQAGKVRVLGASNFSGRRLFEARVLAGMGLPRFETIQEHYNLMHREEYEGDVALVAQSQGLGVLPHYALAHGFLGGEYRRRADGIGNARRARAGQYLNRRGLRVLSVLDRISTQRGVSNAQVALAWLLARPGVVAPVVSADSARHVDEMVRAAALQLTASEISELDHVSSLERRGSHDLTRQAD